MARPRAKAAEKLTELSIAALKPAPAGQRYELADKAMPGLLVRVTDKGKRTFVYYTVYPRTGSSARRALGVVGKMTLHDARLKAQAWERLISKGIDPADHEEEERAAERRRYDHTLAVVVEKYISEKQIGLDPDNPDKRQWEKVAGNLRAELVNDGLDSKGWKRLGLGPRPIDSITLIELVAIISDVKVRAPTTARHLGQQMKALWKWARSQGIVTANPAEHMDLMDIVGDKSERTRWLDDDEIFAFWRATGRSLAKQWSAVAGGRPRADGLPNLSAVGEHELVRYRRVGWSESARQDIGATYPWGPLYRLLMLTGARHAEILEARWGEIDMARRVLTVPPERFKSKMEHKIQLSDMAMQVLSELPRFNEGDYLFSTDNGLSPCHQNGKAMERLDERMALTILALKRARGDGVQRVVKARMERRKKLKARVTQPARRMVKAVDRISRREEDPSRLVVPHWILHDLRRTMRLHLSSTQTSARVQQEFLDTIDAIENPAIRQAMRRQMQAIGKQLEAARIQDHVIEMVLGHGRTGIQRVYDQHGYEAEMRDAMELWADKLRTLIAPKPTNTPSNVVPLAVRA